MNNGKICVSVCAKTADELIKQIERAGNTADVIEIRFDCLDGIQLKKLLDTIKELPQTFLITFRPQEYGGKRQISLSERRKFWQVISSFKNAVYFDIESDLQKKFTVFRFDSRIASFHSFVAGDCEIETIYKQLSQTK